MEGGCCGPFVDAGLRLRTSVNTPSRLCALAVVVVGSVVVYAAFLIRAGGLSPNECDEPIPAWIDLEAAVGLTFAGLLTLYLGHAASASRFDDEFDGIEPGFAPSRRLWIDVLALLILIVYILFRVAWLITGLVFVSHTDTVSCPAGAGDAWRLTVAYIASHAALLVFLALAACVHAHLRAYTAEQLTLPGPALPVSAARRGGSGHCRTQRSRLSW